MHLLEYKSAVLPAEHGKLVIVHLGDLFSCVFDMTEGRFIHAGESIEKRGFSGTAGSHDDSKITLVDFEVKILDDVILLPGYRETFAEFVCFDDRFSVHCRDSFRHYGISIKQMTLLNLCESFNRFLNRKIRIREAKGGERR